MAEASPGAVPRFGGGVRSPALAAPASPATPAFAIASGALPPAASLLVSVSDAVVRAFAALKTKRAHAWLLLRVDEASFSLELAGSAPPSPGALPALLRALPPAEGRFFVFDKEIKNSYGGTGSRILFFTWAPPSAGRTNVVYAAQRRALNSTFTGVIDAHAACTADIEAVLKEGKGEEGNEEWDPDA